MTRHVLVHGAGGDDRYFSRLLPLLPDAVAVALPPVATTWGECVDVIVSAAGDEPAVLVGQSMGAFAVALAATSVRATEVVLLAPMIPAPGERAGGWWARTGHADAARAAALARGLDPAAVVPGPDFDPATTFLHDLADDLPEPPPEPTWPAAALFDADYPLTAWPDVPTRVLAARDDRLFPLAFVRGLARDRLGVEAETIPGGHLVALSQPAALAAALRS